MVFTMRNYITKDFFPFVKFITRDAQLAYYSRDTKPESFCNRITEGIKLPDTVDHASWWEENKHVVRRKVSQLRSDRISTLKTNYIGK